MVKTFKYVRSVLKQQYLLHFLLTVCDLEHAKVVHGHLGSTISKTVFFTALRRKTVLKIYSESNILRLVIRQSEIWRLSICQTVI